MKIDVSGIDRLLNEGKNKEVRARVGYFEDSGVHPRSGETAADIAIINNEGSTDQNIPERPFVTDGANEGILRTELELARYYEKFQRGEISLKNAILKVSKIQEESITSTLDLAPALYRANAPATIQRKGRDEPLNEFGWLRTKIDTKVD